MLQSGYGIGPLKKNAVPSKFLPGEPILVESDCDMNLGHNVDIEDPGKGKKFDSEKAAEIEGLILHNKYESVMRTLTIWIVSLQNFINNLFDLNFDKLQRIMYYAG